MLLRLQQVAGNAAVDSLLTQPGPAGRHREDGRPAQSDTHHDDLAAGRDAHGAREAPSDGGTREPKSAISLALRGASSLPKSPQLARRPAPVPPKAPQPAAPTSTVGAAPAAPAPISAPGAPGMAEASGPPPVATEAPAHDSAAGGDDGTPPPPAPGLADDDLEHLDQALDAPSVTSLAEGVDGASANPTDEAAARGGGDAPPLTDEGEASEEPTPGDLAAGPDQASDVAASGAEPTTESSPETPNVPEPAVEEPPSGESPSEESTTAREGAPGESAPDDTAVQGEVAAAAQGEVEEASAEGPDPATGGGGGGAGGAIEDPPTPALPEVSSAPPETAMASLATLRPTQMAATVSGVESAASRAVGREQARLAAAPPRHTPLAAGSVATPASELIPASGATSNARFAQAPAGQPRPQATPAPLPAPSPPALGRVPAPSLTAAPQGELTQDSARELATSIERLPARDTGVQTTPGPAPQLRLAGDADPGQVAAQQAHLLQGAAHARGEGARDAAEPLGEDAVRPTTPVETLEAEGTDPAPGRDDAAAAAPTADEPADANGSGDDAAVNAVAEEQQGPALRAAASSAAGSMTASRQQHADQERTQRQESAQQIASMEQQHAQAESAERGSVRTEVANQRSQWRAEQHTLVAGAHAEAAAATTQAGQTIDTERAQAQTEAATAHAQGAQEATEAQQEGEREAARHRDEARQESGDGGFFGWVASRATALFDRVKQGISAAFERARQAVRAAIERAQQLAAAVIERARQAVVAAIRAAGAVLTAIGDRLLAGFPALRDRFRNAIRDAVRRAESVVNRLAEGLKAGVRAALGLLGRALTAALSGLEAGLKAAVDRVAAVVQGAISAARAALQAIGAFMAIARDVAANPGAWLRNLAAAVMDGLRNHLWKALKTAVQQWFNDKVEQVLGLGRAVWNLLTRGGISLAQIGRMAWEGIKQAIPAALIGLLVEKLASMIIPAAGAVLAIIQGLQAAWGAVSRVLQAIDRFITFLKAVKSGNGGPAFAGAVAAAGVAVVDFVSNWLLARLARGASAVAGRIRAIAQRIGGALRRVGRRIGGAVRRIGARMGGRIRDVRDRFRRWRDARRDRRDRQRGRDPSERRRREERAKQDRLDRAVRELRPRLAPLIDRGTTGLRLQAQLLYWRLRYRLTSLSIDRSSNTARIRATVNPSADVAEAVRIIGSQLHDILWEVGQSLITDPALAEQVARIRGDREEGLGLQGQGANRASSSYSNLPPPADRPHAPGTTRPAESPAAEAAALRTSSGVNPRYPYQMEHVEMVPATTDRAAVLITEQQSQHAGPGSMKVRSIGGHGHYDPNVINALQAAHAVGMTPQQVRTSVYEILQGRHPTAPQLSDNQELTQRLASVGRLMFTVEPARHSGAMATSFMGWELAGTPGAGAADQPWGQHVAIGNNPMAPVGATDEARSSRIPEADRTAAQAIASRAHLEREVAVVIRYLEMLNRPPNEPIFAHTQACVDWIRTSLREHLAQRLRGVVSTER